VARISRFAPTILLGYFFGPKLGAIPSPDHVLRLTPSEAVRVMRFGYLGLATGQWPRICSSELNQVEWPVLPFIRRDLISGKAYTVTYSDDIAEETSIRPATTEEVDHLPKDGLSGHGAVEIVLTKLLAG
jgi:hypothetical protein